MEPKFILTEDIVPLGSPKSLFSQRGAGKSMAIGSMVLRGISPEMDNALDAIAGLANGTVTAEEAEASIKALKAHTQKTKALLKAAKAEVF